MIVYTDSLDGISAEHLRGGFFAGWARPLTPETHLRVLRGSDGIILAIDSQTEDVVGYISAISDGVLTVFISNLEVLPVYQGHGIGSELVRRMLDKFAHLPNADLMCDASVQPFYARLGLRPCPGMVLRKHNLDINR